MSDTLQDLTALLLCGGKGERLRPLTQSMPKPLVPVRGRPIVSYVVGGLRARGIRRLVVATGFQASKMAAYFKEDHQDLDVTLVDSGDADILERLRACAKHLQGDFLVLYGDTLADVDLEALADFHRSHPGKATVTVWPMRSPFGVLEFGDMSRIRSFKEKPVLDKWINIGYFYFDRDALSLCPDSKGFAEFLTGLVEREELYGFRHEGVHITVNTQQELAEAERRIEDFQAGIEHG